MNQVDTIRNAIFNIAELVERQEPLSKPEKLRIYNIVEAFIFRQIGMETLIGPEKLTDLQSINALKSMIEPAKREQRELDPLEKEIIRCTAKSLLLALGFK